MNTTQYVAICEQIPVNISLENCPKEIVFERVPIKQETILDIINCGLWHVPDNPSTIFIGPDEMMELTMDYRFTKVSNELQLKFKNLYRVQGKYYDIDLVIVPHMKGVLII